MRAEAADRPRSRAGAVRAAGRGALARLQEHAGRTQRVRWHQRLLLPRRPARHTHTLG